MVYDFDLLTIGGGSGGVRVARWSAGLGAKVAICERSRYGGTCVLRGCIPKKLMLVGSELPDSMKYFSSYGWSIGDYSLNWQVQKSARDKELTRLEGIYENLLSKKGVTVLKGHGKIVAPHQVEVDGKKYTAKFILIAVGCQPSLLNIPGREWALTSDDLFELTEQPRSILIMGSGYIGVEFASIFNGFGSKVSLVFRKDTLLRGFDNELRVFLQEEMIKRGVEIIPQRTVSKIVKKEDRGFEVTLSRPSKQNRDSGLGKAEFTGDNDLERCDNDLERSEQNTFSVASSAETTKASNMEIVKTVDKVLFATGRIPMTDNLGLESVGIETNKRGEVEVNEYFETSAKNVYALGDCANTPYQLTPVATSEGMILAEHLFSGSKQKMDYRFVPTAVFSRPPVAVVGLTEEQAQEKGYEVSVYTTRFRPLKYTVTSIDKKTFIKMVVDKKTNKVLGVFMVGDDAPEIMQGMAVALKAGATKADFDKTVGIHPTSAEELVTMR